MAVGPGLLGLMGGRALSAPPYRGPVSDHFNGKNFFNLHNRGPRGLRDVLRWQWTKQQGLWHAFRHHPAGEAPPERVDNGGLRTTFVNHASVLIQMDGLNILTDPIWSNRCSAVSWIGPHRARPPGIQFGDLPPIDVILLSHNHYDHLDVPTLRRLHKQHEPKIFAPLGNTAFLDEQKIGRGEDMDWWDSVDLNSDVRLTCVPAEHWSGRGTADRAATLWGGYMIEGPSGRMLFAGDTGYGPHFGEIRKKFGAPRLALLPIGAYLPRWFMKPVHMSPSDAVDAHEELGATMSMAIHFGTFKLADDAQDQPIEELARVVADSNGLKESFWSPEFGEGRDIPEAEA